MSKLSLPELYIGLKLLDKNNKVIKHWPIRPSHSWVENHYIITFCNISTSQSLVANNTDVIDVGGTTRSGENPQPLVAAPAGWGTAADTALVGIVVGSGSTAEAFTDYALDTQIDNGTGASQLQYGADGRGYALVGLDRIITMQRHFVNQSGGNVSVNEIGMIAQVGCIHPTYYYVLLARDVLSATVVIPDTHMLQVEYQMTVTFPE